MATTRVQLPNGDIGEFPAGMGQDQIQAVLAKQFPPPSQSTDPSGRTPTGEPAPDDTRNAFQRLVDNASTSDPRREEWQSPAHNAFDKAAEGTTGGVWAPIAHPIEALKGFGRLVNAGIEASHGNVMPAVDVATPMVKGAIENPIGTAGNLLGGAATGDLGGAVLGAGMRALAGPMERGGLGLGNAALGARGPKPFKYGANPARGAFEEGVLPAISKHSASMKLADALPNVGQRISDKVMAGGTVPSANIARSIDTPITDAGNVMAGFGGGKSLDPVTNLWASMEEKAPNASAPIYGKNAPANSTAPDVWHSIRNLDKNTRFNPDPEVEGVNELRRDIRGGLRGNLEDAVPGLKPESRTYGDLKSAEETLDRTLHGGTSLRKMLNVPMFPVETTVGRAMYGAGKAMAKPSVFSNAGPAFGLVQSLRDKKKEQ